MGRRIYRSGLSVRCNDAELREDETHLPASIKAHQMVPLQIDRECQPNMQNGGARRWVVVQHFGRPNRGDDCHNRLICGSPVVTSRL